MNTLNFNLAMSFEPPELLIRRFCSERNVSDEEARERFQETKKFLVLCASGLNCSYSPSEKVDAMWHQFMLHSKDYFRFCELVGGYVHHQPSEEHQPERYARTLEGLRRIFGNVNQFYWEERAAGCSDNCGVCSN